LELYRHSRTLGGSTVPHTWHGGSSVVIYVILQKFVARHWSYFTHNFIKGCPHSKFSETKKLALA
jgi:hypothetical protein